MKVRVSGLNEDAQFRQIGFLEYSGESQTVIAIPASEPVLQSILEGTVPWKRLERKTSQLNWLDALSRYYVGPRLICSNLE